MAVRVQSEAKLAVLLRQLAEDAQVAAIHHRLASDLSAAVGEYRRELNEANAFWSLTMYAHFSEVRTRLCRLYDQHVSALSLRTWLDAVAEIMRAAKSPEAPLIQALQEKLASVGSHSVKSDLTQVRTGDPLVKKLVKLRNNVVAHTSPGNIIEKHEIEELFGLSFAESDVLVRRAVRIVNTYGQCLVCTSWATQIVGHDDYLSILRAVRFHGNAVEATIQAEIDAATKA